MVSDITRKMLSLIRESNETSKKNKFVIKKNTPMFGDVRTSQEENIFKTIGERVDLEDDALVYYSADKRLVLTGKIGNLNIAFQFVYNDSNGEGCYIWANELQLTDQNERVLGKIRDAFVNWKQGLNKDVDFMTKLHKETEK